MHFLYCTGNRSGVKHAYARAAVMRGSRTYLRY
jgi:hypothetical protein